MAIRRGPQRAVPSRQPGTAGNLGATFTGYGVGIPSYLNEYEKNVGRYWRFIEYGSNGFSGKLMGGLWGVQRGQESQLVPFGQGVGQQFIPFGPQGRAGDEESAKRGAQAALFWLFEHRPGMFRSNPKYTPEQIFFLLSRSIRRGEPGPTLGYVHEEIPGMHAYRTAAQRFGPQEREAQVLAQVLPKAILDQAKGRRAPSQRGRQRTAVGRAGFITGFALSDFARDIGDRIDQQLRRELTEANRLLAQALAGEVAAAIEEETLRPAASSGALAEAAVQPGNRFPV